MVQKTQFKYAQFSRLTEHGPVLRSTEDYRNPIKCGNPPGRSRSPDSLCQICSAACFRFVSMKVRQRGACLRGSVVLPYVSVLLATKFTTSEIPFCLVK